LIFNLLNMEKIKTMEALDLSRIKKKMEILVLSRIRENVKFRIKLNLCSFFKLHLQDFEPAIFT